MVCLLPSPKCGDCFHNGTSSFRNKQAVQANASCTERQASQARLGTFIFQVTFLVITWFLVVQRLTRTVLVKLQLSMIHTDQISSETHKKGFGGLGMVSRSILRETHIGLSMIYKPDLF